MREYNQLNNKLKDMKANEELKRSRKHSTRKSGSTTRDCTKDNVVCLQQKAKKLKRVPSKKLKRLLSKIGAFALGFMCVAPVTFVGSFIRGFVTGAQADMSTLSHMVIITLVLGCGFGLFLQKMMVDAR